MWNPYEIGLELKSGIKKLNLFKKAIASILACQPLLNRQNNNLMHLLIYNNHTNFQKEDSICKRDDLSEKCEIKDDTILATIKSYPLWKVNDMSNSAAEKKFNASNLIFLKNY